MEWNFSGFIAVDKPQDWTSHDVVAWLRSRLGIKKIGHAGTLDPMATGVLILGIGREGTSKLDQWHQFEKKYEAEMTLGANSTTDDAEGEFTLVSDKVPTKEEIEAAAATFVGAIMQMPPRYSAKKIKGVKSYHAARQGKELELVPVPVKIHSIAVGEYEYPRCRLSVNCGTGTYVRAIARDIGEALGTGAYLSSLVRSSIGPIGLDRCLKLDRYLAMPKEEASDALRNALHGYRVPAPLDLLLFSC